MRPVRTKFIGLAAVLAAAVAVAASESSAGAAPLPGGSFIRSTWPSTPTYLFFTTDVGDTTGGLTGLGCPFLPQDAATEAQAAHLAYAYHGWLGPIEDADTNPNQQVVLRTQVAGTVEDATGNSYNLAGDFVDSTTHFLFNPDLMFDGFGEVTLAGPAGVVVGMAELRLVNAPLDYDFVFTSIRQCHIKAAG